jgi:1,4-dihydroxy-2-naphthoyl-CoA synthase
MAVVPVGGMGIGGGNEIHLLCELGCVVDGGGLDG